MRAHVRQPLVATSFIAIGALAGCYFAPPFFRDGGLSYLASLPYGFAGAFVGAVAYFGLLLNGQNPQNAKFRLSIREVISLTFVVAMICGWWVNRTELYGEIARRENEIFKLRYEASLRHAFGGGERNWK
jgi:hypothetical protein